MDSRITDESHRRTARPSGGRGGYTHAFRRCERERYHEAENAIAFGQSSIVLMTGAKPNGRATAKSTAESIASLLGDRELVVVSNREPYSHDRENGEIRVDRPAGGLTSALDPVLETAGGTWIAWGSGDADREVVDDDDCVRVPPDSPAYDLKRVWLSDDLVDGYYYGYSNRVLWPACHCDTAKITPSREFWNAYRNANRAFADAVLERDDENQLIWFQDYHLSLAPRMVREERPDAFLMQFWHIPWPSWDVFQACPQYRELLEGLLANDLIGFHTDRYCRNFLDCVSAALDVTVDRATRSIAADGRRTFVRSFPLGIEAEDRRQLAKSSEASTVWNGLKADSGVDEDARVAVGVDRLDYTKGIEKRLAALEHLWETRPEWRRRLTYVQKATESRSRIPEYHELQERVESKIEAINDRFGTAEWQPVVYLKEMIPPAGLAALYREADLALVSSVRDGMNLVSKEFVASQVDDSGVLMLSELAGASEELGDEALLVQPYDTEGFADAIEEGLRMPQDDRERRMRELQRQVHSNDIYAWLESQFRTVTAIERGRDLPRNASPAQD